MYSLFMQELSVLQALLNLLDLLGRQDWSELLVKRGLLDLRDLQVKQDLLG